jgi:choice-of-anchor B domain-containing protein
MRLTLLSLIILSFSLLSVHAQFNISLVGNLNYTPNVNDIWGYVTPAPDSTEYALMGMSTGTAIISLANPASPVQVAFVPGATSTWRDIKTWGDRAYISNESSGGIAIVDLSDLHNGNISYHNYTLPVPGSGNVTRAHNLWVDEQGYLYVMGARSGGTPVNGGGVLIFDVFTEPDTPTFVGKSLSQYSHDAYARGNKLYSADIYQGAFTIYDITNRNNPIPLNFENTDFNFTHNVWLSDDGNILYTTDELANAPVGIFDVTDPMDIVRIGAFRPTQSVGQGVIPHNVHIKDDFAVVSHYTDGLVVFDGKRPHNPVEVGVYDTYTGPGTGFNGAWGAYPFLPSGLIIVSDIQTGLYVLQPQYQRACWLEGTVTDATTSLPINEVSVNILQTSGQTSTGFDGTYATGFANAGTYDVTFSKSGYQPFTTTVNLVNDSLIILNVQLSPIICEVEITCPTVSNPYYTDNGLCAASLSFSAEANVICDSPIIEYFINNQLISFPHNFQTGLTTVVSIATNAQGFSDTCSFDVQVLDNEPPVVICPDTIFKSTDPGQCGAIVEFNFPANDNCILDTIVFSPASGSFFMIGNTSVTLIASDIAGNTFTCTYLVSVADAEAPLVSCPDDITVFNDPGQCGAIVTFEATATDNCGATVSYEPASGSFFTVGNTIVTATAADSAGNTSTCTFELTVNDTEAPIISCPDNITVSNDPGQCGAIVTFDATASDNCGVSISYQPASGSFFTVGNTIVTATATDSAGNTSTCTFELTVNDTEAPLVSCSDDITVSNDPGQCGAIVSFEATATDNCGASISYQPASDSFFSVGTTIVTATATDSSGNTSTCTFEIIVNDTETPIISCPVDITVSNDPGQCGAIVIFEATATDNCGATVSYEPASGSFFTVGNTIVTATATDSAGNTSTCTFEIIVNDTETPIISCPVDITVSNDPGQCGAIVIFEATATDNCGASINYQPASGSFFTVGTTIVIATATDSAGNTSTCTFELTVNDTEAPIISCPDDITVSNDPGQCGAIISFTATATDNCGASMSYQPASGSFFSVGTTIVTATATDSAGNTSTCTFGVTVNDTEAPIISCPDDITVSNDPGQCGAIVTFEATATDNCGVNLSYQPTSGSFLK